MRISHERTIGAPVDRVGSLFDALGRDGDRLWPAPAWLPIRLDRPLAVGADGGHGPIRYWVSEYVPGRRVRFTFHADLGLDGYHELSVRALDERRCVLRHDLNARPRGTMRVLVPLAMRWVHDALVEDLFDRAEWVATGWVERRASWSPYVHLLWRLSEFPPPRAAATPADADLLRQRLGDAEYADSRRIELSPGMPTDPERWAEAIFMDPPAWVTTLLAARNVLVRLIGVDTADRSVFAPRERTDREVLLGVAGRQFDFRVSIYVDTEELTLSTTAHAHNRAGRTYLRLIWPLHPLIVKSMVSHARRTLARHYARAAIDAEPEPAVR